MSTSKTLAYLIAGAAIGAAAGILLAPDSGSKTRKKIAKGASDFYDDVKDKAEGIADHVKDGYNTAKNNFAKAF